MENSDKNQKNASNKDIHWAEHYDFYEIEFRHMYKTASLPQNESHYKMLESKAARYLKKENVFCEIGFSAGLTIRYALKHFGTVYGLDISPKNVEYTKKELQEEGYNNFYLFESDLMNFNSRFENKFDVISFIHGLEHFSEDDYKIVLDNIRKYLKANGIFTGALPFKNNFNYRMCPECHHVFEIDGHVSSHDIDSLKIVFEENNYKILHLDNFNLKYQLKQGNFFKKIYRTIVYGILKKRLNGQLEFIVTPC